MDKATALRNAGVGSRGDTFSLETALRAALLGDGIATFAGNPNGNVTPVNIGEFCLDTTSLIYYRATTTANTGWRETTINHTSRCLLFDDFLGDVIADEWDTKLGSTNASVAVVAGLNGTIRMTTNSSATETTLAGGGVQLQSALNWQANQGGLSVEFRIKPVTTSTNSGLFVGLCDQVSSLAMPITIADGAAAVATVTGSDGVGFFWNPAATTTINTWAIGGNKAGTGTAVTLLTSAPVALTWERLRIDVSATGTATFYRNDVLVATLANALTVSVPLTPVITMRHRKKTVAQTLDVDYIKISQLR